MTSGHTDECNKEGGCALVGSCQVTALRARLTAAEGLLREVDEAILEHDDDNPGLRAMVRAFLAAPPGRREAGPCGRCGRTVEQTITAGAGGAWDTSKYRECMECDPDGKSRYGAAPPGRRDAGPCGDVPAPNFGGPCKLEFGHDGDCGNGGPWHWSRVSPVPGRKAWTSRAAPIPQPAPAPEVEPAPRYCYCYSPAEPDPCDDWKAGRYCRFDPRRPATPGDGR